MGNFGVVIPTATTNLFRDSSFEYGTLATYWTTDVGGGTGTAALSTARSFFGKSCVQMVGGSVYSHVYQSITTAAASYTISAYVYTDGTAVTDSSFKLLIDGNEASPTFTAIGGGWYRAVYTAVETAAAHLTGLKAMAGATVYVDGCQFEAQTTVTTYCDGTQPGCTWNGAAHASTSTRSAQSRAGGRVIDIEDTYGVTASLMSGFGMLAPVQNYNEQALLPGALLQSSKTPTRLFTLLLKANGTSLANLHSIRKDLIDAFKPDLVKRIGRKPQPIRLRYSGAGTTVEIACHYAGGLEGNIGVGKFEALPVRFTCEDPFWYELNDGAAVLTETLSVADANYAVKRIDGTWSNISTAFNGAIYAIAKHPDGSIYLGGAFTNVGDANGDYIVKYTPATGTLTSLGTGMNGNVNALAIGPDGTVYAGGAFTSAGGVANTGYFAKWTGSAWEAVGAGVGAATMTAVYALAVGQDGTVYIGGSFLNWGDANGDRLVTWTGSAYASLSTGLDNTAYALAVGPDGSIYVGGAFTTAGGTACNYIAKWNGSAFVALGAGFDAAVYAVAVSSSGTVYAGGDFTVGSGSAGNYIAMWNGSSWSGLANGLNGTVTTLVLDDDGLLYVAGAFTIANNLALADRLAIWNGTSWAHLAIDLPGTPNDFALVASRGDLYIGYTTSGTATTAKVNTVTNNGTTETYPKLIIKRSGGTTARLEWLKNETTGKTCWFNYSLLDEETLTIDFQARTITSDFFGNVIGRARLPGSDFASWSLLAGANSVSLYVYEAGTPTVTAYMLWKQAHHSVDGVAA